MYVLDVLDTTKKKKTVNGQSLSSVRKRRDFYLSICR